MTTLQGALETTTTALDGALARRAFALRLREVGVVTHVGGGIARVAGLPALTAEELVEFRTGQLGITVDLEPETAGVVLLGDATGLAAGTEVRATGRIADTPVGEPLIGRVVDATGRPLDGGRRPALRERRPIERAAPPILDRAPVARPLLTGLKVVDALVPIGRGQRELIAGDRQTGKTTVALDTILHQHDQDVLCVYCAIGQRGTAVARVIETLRAAGALRYSIVVVAEGDAAPGLQYVTPFAATTIAEYFAERGRDVLIVYDDLTRHARAYRELSLLLRRPPGREAYPGDIFYLHARLLERSAQLSRARGGGSLTALPIVETQAQDISAYIPTNLISITDGQILMSAGLYRRGQLPAVDVGLSVSRVGGKAQPASYRAVTSDLRLAYSQFEELETFSRFATRLDDETRATIERGRRVRAVLAQREHMTLAVPDQLVVFHAVTQGLLDALAPSDVALAEQTICAAVRAEHPDLYVRLERGEAPDGAAVEALLRTARAALAAGR